MKTFQRICIKDMKFNDLLNQEFKIERGREYITSEADENGFVTVFSTYWVNIPVELFAGEKIFTNS